MEVKVNLLRLSHSGQNNLIKKKNANACHCCLGEVMTDAATKGRKRSKTYQRRTAVAKVASPEDVTRRVSSCGVPAWDTRDINTCKSTLK